MTKLHYPGIATAKAKPLAPQGPHRLKIIELESGIASGDSKRPFVAAIIQVAPEEGDYSLIKHRLNLTMEGDSENTLVGMALFSKAFANAFSIPIDEDERMDTDDMLGAEGMIHVVHEMSSRNRPFASLELELPKA